MPGARQRAQRTLDGDAGEDPSRSRSPVQSSSSTATASGRAGGVRQRALEAQAVPGHLGPDVGQASATEFRQHVASLFLQNKFSGADAVQLVTKAQHAGAFGVDDLAKAGGGGKHLQNASRDLLAMLVRNCDWPSVYMAPIPLYNESKGCLEPTLLPFLLPHELVGHLLEGKDLEPFCRLEPTLGILRDSVCQKLGLDVGSFVALGMHGDGVPHQKRKSIEVLSWNFLGQGMHRRFPVAVVEKAFCCRCGCSGRHTLEPMLEVFCWSVRCLVAGGYPKARHDGTPWGQHDGSRMHLSGPLPCHGALLQIRADWAWYKQAFAFPGWANKAICWRCRADKDQCPYWDFSLTAAWRQHRYVPGEFMARMRSEGHKPSCIFQLPGFTLDMVTIDVLHALDLGCSQDIVGNVLWEVLHSRVCPEKNLQLKIEGLWTKLKLHYRTLGTPNRLQGLTLAMVRQEGKGPKMRTKGAETKGLVPFALECAQALHNTSPSAHTATVLQMVSCLLEFYLLLGLPEWNASCAAAAARKCCLLYSALGTEARMAGDSPFWRVKPKFHLWVELAEFQSPLLGNPASFWTYKDEDFVGYVAGLASSRGGPKTAASTALKALQRVRALAALGD